MKNLAIKPGLWVWIPCEVKPGPFSNERSILVQTPLGQPWVGFVDVRFLREPIVRGSTAVQALVADVRGERILLTLPGQPVDSSRVREIKKQDAEKVPLVPVPA
jgi:hypothetical protein